MVSIDKKLELAWQSKNLGKLGEREQMIYNFEWKKCSSEEQNEIYKIAFFLERMCYKYGWKM